MGKRERNARACTRVRGLLLTLAVCVSVLAGCAAEDHPGEKLVDYQFQYLYVSPIGPFFKPVKLDDGTVLMRPVRIGADVDSALPKTFPLLKKKDVLRVFIVGGSVVQLFDERVLLRMLRRSLPWYEFEIIDCGISAYDSYRDSLTVSEIVKYDPDLIVVMSGVNEGELGGPRAVQRISRLLRGMLRGVLRGHPLRAFGLSWPQVRSGASPKEMARRFETNLSKMARTAGRAGVPMVLCTLPWNMRDMPPRGSAPFEDEGFTRAWMSVERGDLGSAAEGLRAYLKTLRPGDSRGRAALDKRRAFAQFYLARVLERLGAPDGARAHYIDSLRSQIPPMPLLNQAVRRVAGRTGLPLADLDRAFTATAAHGLVGNALFEDEMHWERFADPLVSAVVVSAIADSNRWLGTRILAPAEAWDLGWFDSGKKALLNPRLGDKERTGKAWTVFTYRVWDNPIRALQGRVSERVVALMDYVYSARPGLMLSADKMKEWVRERLRGNIWSASPVHELDSWWPAMMGNIGEMFLRRGRLADAIRFFDAALREDPAQPYLRFRRAVASAYQGDRKGAVEALKKIGPEGKAFPEIGYYERRFEEELERAPREKGRGAGGRTPAVKAGPEDPKALMEEGETVLSLSLRADDAQSGVPSWRRMDPQVEKKLDPALKSFAKGEARKGFSLYHQALASSSNTVWAIQEFCKARQRRCRPLEEARQRQTRLSDEGIRLFGAGDTAGALKAFERALADDPEDLSALLNRAAVAAKTGDQEAALRFYGRAVALDFSNPGQRADALSSRAMVLEAMGRRGEAVRDLRRVLESAPPEWPRKGEVREALQRLDAKETP